jgi:Transposase domain (DUF772)
MPSRIVALPQFDTVGEPTEKTERERIVLLRKRFQCHDKEKNVMSLKAAPIGPIPQETARLAKAVFPEGSTCMKMRDEFGTLFQDELFATLFPKDGQPALAPWRLALVTIMQCAEKLSDRQAAHAVRARLDGKYALGLELEDQGFDFSVRMSRFAHDSSKATWNLCCSRPCSPVRKHRGLDLCRRSTTNRCHPCASGSSCHE